MNLQPRMTQYEAFTEVLANSANVSWRAVTLDATAFDGKVEIGTALSVDEATGKAQPWDDEAPGEAVLLGRTVIVKDADIVTTAIEGGIVFESKCHGITDAFKDACKLIKFR